MSWTANSLMWWNGEKVTDHNRSPLSEDIERFGADRRMANGTLRRQHITFKRKWTVSWERLPSSGNAPGGIRPVDGGMAGEDIEQFYRDIHGEFELILRRGSARDKEVPEYETLPYEDDDFVITRAMITSFAKEVVSRGAVDMWNVNITLEEV